ncbi:MAG TPA: hypothetical protein PLP98_14370 [Plasticicumulans sp.]|nr:hypothetical protein [Plasticicumulans sp.]
MLTAEERTICQRIGIDEAAFLAAKTPETRQNLPAPVSELSGRSAALTAEEQTICRRCGITEAAFLAARNAA